MSPLASAAAPPRPFAVESQLVSNGTLFARFAEATCRMDDIQLYRLAAKGIFEGIASDAVLDLCERALETGELVPESLAALRQMRADAVAGLRRLPTPEAP